MGRALIQLLEEVNSEQDERLAGHGSCSFTLNRCRDQPENERPPSAESSTDFDPEPITRRIGADGAWMRWPTELRRHSSAKGRKNLRQRFVYSQFQIFEHKALAFRAA